MVNVKPLKADIKMIMREPILVLILLIPPFIYVLFKLLTLYAVPVLYRYTGFDLSVYYGYVMAMAFLLTPYMLGTVSAFLMIDERDARISELISITPVGGGGYLRNRLIIPFFGSILFSLIGYRILDIYSIHVVILLMVSLLLGIDSVLIAITLFLLADDKVKGLTYAKGLNILAVLSLADLLNTPWVSGFAALLPFYWIVRMVNDPQPALAVIIACLNHVVYLALLLSLYRRAKQG